VVWSLSDEIPLSESESVASREVSASSVEELLRRQESAGTVLRNLEKVREMREEVARMWNGQLPEYLADPVRANLPKDLLK